MQRAKTVWIAGGVGLVVIAGSLGYIGWQRHQESGRDDAAHTAAQSFVKAWGSKQLDQVGWVGAAGSAMQTEYAALVSGLGGLKPTLHLGDVQRHGTKATATVDTAWPLPGGETWHYTGSVTLTERSGHWLVDPDGVSGSSIFAPIPRDDRLVLSHKQATRGVITGRGGAKIVAPGPVVDVGIEPARVTDAASLVQQVAHITGVDRAALTKALAAAAPHAFVPVITLRQADYDKVKDKLQPLKGTVFVARDAGAGPQPRLRASPDRDGRAGHGRDRRPARRTVTSQAISPVCPACSDCTTSSCPGLRRTPISEVPKTGATPDSAQALFTTTGRAGQPLATTLDPKTQVAADQALAKLKVPGALVALDVRSGGVLAVANTPANGSEPGHGRPLPARARPSRSPRRWRCSRAGSSRRPWSTARRPRRSAGGRSATSNTSSAGGCRSAPTSRTPATPRSSGCRQRLKADDLHAAGLTLGLGVDWGAALGAGDQTFTGSIPTTTGAVDQAAASFGQGRNLVSPLSMAVLAGSVARGKFLAPTLVTSPAPTGAAPAAVSPPAAKDIATLHSLMRLVVTSGTAAGKFTNVSGGPVFAKTGTAEFGSDSPPQTHAWLVGWQGNIAFAAFVEEGESGGSVAAPVVRDFLDRLHR